MRMLAKVGYSSSSPPTYVILKSKQKTMYKQKEHLA